MELVPGRQCGPFVLGMNLYHAMQVVQSLDFSSSAVRQTHHHHHRHAPPQTSISFSRPHPLDSPIVLDVCRLGLRLRFHPAAQVLYLIEVYDLSLAAVSLNRGQHIMGGGGDDVRRDDALTLKALYPVLGATHAGFRRAELGRDAFCFQYPGFLIQFTVPEKEVFQGIPFVLQSTNQSPIASRFFVHDVDFPKTITPKHLHAHTAASGNGASSSQYLHWPLQVEVVFKDNGPHITFTRGLSGGGGSTTGFVIRLGETHCQDVLANLGPPGATCLKQRGAFAKGGDSLHGGRGNNNDDDDRGSSNEYDLHSASSSSSSLDSDADDFASDYYFNYFALGVDVLLSGSRHVVKRVILRTNLVPHAQFNSYAKCCFTVKFQLKPRKQQQAPSPLVAPKQKKAAGAATTAATNGDNNANAERSFTCDDKWLTIANKLDMQNDQPMVHEPPEQPFGPCLLFTTVHSVFEIDQHSQHIATYTIY